MYYAGLDAHLAYVTVTVVDKSGTVRLERRVPSRSPELLVKTLQRFTPIEAVVETCPFWPWIYDLLTPLGIRVHVAHARELRAIAASHRKTDERDATLLARMLATRLIPAIYPKTAAQREAATLIRHRAFLVRERTGCANRIHAQLHQRRLSLPRGQLRRRAARTWLKTEAWPRLSPEQRRLVRTLLTLVRRLTTMIRALDRVIAVRAAASPAAVVLRTIPGIGPCRGLLLATELTPITRFPSPAHLTSYAGLAPTTRSSGGRTTRGPIPRGANRAVRGALVAAIPSHMKVAATSSLGQYYTRLKPRVGWPVARVAAARRLAHVIYRMLQTGEAWRG
jgi:transposase